MVVAKAVEKCNVPIFFSGWMDKSSKNCMFDKFILKMSKLTHLRTCAYYFKCPRNACPANDAPSWLRLMLSQSMTCLPRDLENWKRS